MVTIKCSESGIEFEAATKRTKQHPAIADMKADANKRGTYAALNDALMAVKRAGGYTTIDEYVALVKAQMAGVKPPMSYKARQQIERDEAEARKAARAAQNAHLRAHGYVWQVEYVDRDAYALEERSEGKYFYLTAPDDGRIVSVEDALAEIKYGAELAQAHAAAITEDRERTERQRAQAAEAEEAAYQAAEAAAIDGMTEVEGVSYSTVKTWQVVAVKRSAALVRHVYVGETNGIKCAAIDQGSNAFGDYIRVYCADPAAAGLTPVKLDEFDQTMRRYF